MKRAIVHIGAHKTGTTYLQRVFQALRPALRDAGVAFPARWSQSDDQPSHRTLYEALASGAMIDLREDADTLLLSSEDFSYLQVPQLDAFRRVLASTSDTAMTVLDQPIAIVFHCRRWCEILPSVWQERIKHGFSETFPQFAAAAMADPNRLEFIDFGKILDRYAAVFGTNAIRIVSYSTVTDLAEHFFDTCLPNQRSLLANAGEVIATRPNQSLGPVDTEIIRVLNLQHTANGGERGPAAREWFSRHGQRHDVTPLLAAIDTNLETLTLSDAEPALEALHQRLWAAYGHRVVEPHPPNRFFAPAEKKIPFANSRYLADPAIQQRFTDLYRAFRTG